MKTVLDRARDLLRPSLDYRRQEPLVLINGLAEQPESWFCNWRHWQEHFDVKMPEFLVYDGEALQARVAGDLPLSVPYFTDQLATYLTQFVQRPPYHLVASSLGCQVAVEYAIRRPDRVRRMVLLCPSGFGGVERLPVVEGVRKNDFESLVASVFHDRRFVHPAIVRHFESQFANRQWRKGFLRTVRGTSGHSVRAQLHHVQCPVLLILGAEDHIVDTAQALEAVRELPNFRTVVLPRCGHAPQIEKASEVNGLVLDFLRAAEHDAALSTADYVLAKPSYA
jgi:pimeloyl-ACP methyl ester carboxylesterase